MNMHEPVRVVAAEAAPTGEAPVGDADGAGAAAAPGVRGAGADHRQRSADGEVELAGAGRRRCRRSATCAPSTTQGFSGDNYSWAVGLQLDWTLYDGGVRDAQRQLAAAQRDENEAKLDLLRDQVRDDVYNAERRARRRGAARWTTARRSLQLSQGDARPGAGAARRRHRDAARPAPGAGQPGRRRSGAGAGALRSGARVACSSTGCPARSRPT